jgi:hypothetical protein
MSSRSVLWRQLKVTIVTVNTMQAVDLTLHIFSYLNCSYEYGRVSLARRKETMWKQNKHGMCRVAAVCGCNAHCLLTKLCTASRVQQRMGNYWGKSLMFFIKFCTKGSNTLYIYTSVSEGDFVKDTLWKSVFNGFVDSKFKFKPNTNCEAFNGACSPSNIRMTRQITITN